MRMCGIIIHACTLTAVKSRMTVYSSSAILLFFRPKLFHLDRIFCVYFVSGPYPVRVTNVHHGEAHAKFHVSDADKTLSDEP